MNSRLEDERQHLCYPEFWIHSHLRKPFEAYHLDTESYPCSLPARALHLWKIPHLNACKPCQR
jgi:hypothetical protein